MIGLSGRSPEWRNWSGCSAGSRTEPAHEEAYIHLTLKEMSRPDVLSAHDALGRWTQENGRQPTGAIRQLLIADQRSATPDTMTCDLSVLLR